MSFKNNLDVDNMTAHISDIYLAYKDGKSKCTEEKKISSVTCVVHAGAWDRHAYMIKNGTAQTWKQCAKPWLGCGYAHTHKHKQTHTHTNAHIHIRTHTLSYIHIHCHTHINTHTHTHSGARTHTRLRTLGTLIKIERKNDVHLCATWCKHNICKQHGNRLRRQRHVAKMLSARTMNDIVPWARLHLFKIKSSGSRTLRNTVQKGRKIRQDLAAVRSSRAAGSSRRQDPADFANPSQQAGGPGAPSSRLCQQSSSLPGTVVRTK